MSAIYIVDASVFLNILDVSEWNQNRDTVLADFEDRTRNLPPTTGNRKAEPERE